MNTKEKIVLCVDDEESISIIFRHIFKDTDEYKAIVLNNASDALTYMKDNHVDIVVTDYMMEPMDGLNFSQEIRKSNKTIPIILQTGWGSSLLYKEKMEALNIGAFLSKPFNKEELFNAIDKLM